jgi:DNA-binding protein YbaB
MVLTVNHPKVNAIASWTQADLDAQIALGNFAPGTTIAQIVLSEDWNTDHSVVGTIEVDGVTITGDGVTTPLVAVGGSTTWGSITGTLSSQTDLQTALNLKANLASPTFTGTVSGITSTMVGLGNVNNTSDAAKPVSTAQQTALNLKANLASPTFTGTVGGITSTMVGLGNVNNTSDANKPVSTAQQTALNLKANLASPTFTGTVGGITSTMVGLGNVTNTSDANKPVSTAQQTALNLKANLASPTFTGTVSGITSTMVGLGNVTNTSDANKPVSTAQQTALNLKANLASPTFTGTVVLPASQIVNGVTLVNAGTATLYLSQDGTYTTPTGGSPAFNTVTGGTNTTAAMVVGTGSSIAATGSGTIVATSTTGNASTVTTNANLTGDITSTGNATAIAAGVIVNADVNASAGIGLSKLAATTINRALVSDASGFVSPATTTAAELGHLSGVTSSVQTQLNSKANLASPTFTGTVGGITSTMVGLGNVNNTSDAAKPVSTAQQTALNLKANLASPTFTGTVGGITSTMVGLGNVNNTSDAAKPVSTATQTALDLKANLASPTFTGTVVLPASQIVNGVTLSTGAGTGNFLRGDGTYTAPTASAAWGSITGTLSSQTDLQTALDLKANLASPTFTGTVTLPIGQVSDRLTLALNAAPATPAADNVSLFGRKIANRMLPAFIGPSGLDSALQPFFGRNKVGQFSPAGASSTAVTTIAWPATTTTGSSATGRAVSTTNLFTRMRRIGYVTTAVAGVVGQFRQSSMGYTIGNGATLGGFTYILRFGISDAAAVSGARMFMGFRSSSTPTNVEPSTLVNCIGMGHRAADTTMHIFYGGTSAQTPIDLGANFPANTRAVDMYELALFSAPNSGDVNYQVTRLNTGDVANGTLSGTAGVALPASTIIIGPWGYRTNNATALAVGMDIVSAYVETDY